MKIEQLSLPATVVIAFAALAALVLTGQAGLRQDLRALQADMRAGQAELRAGQAELRDDLEALGVRLAVVEHRAGVLEAGFAAVTRGTVEWPTAAGTPAASSDASLSPSGKPLRTTPAR